MKRRRSAGSRGSVTVLLALLLVPILVLTGLFVDGGRAVLTRPVVRSAEQLVVNDVLAQHEEKLRSVLGLLAVIDDEKLDESARTLLEAAAEPGGGDILRVSYHGLDGDVVRPVVNSDLAKPEIALNQIVEYMKYRAPVNFMLELANSIEWLINLKDNLETAQKRVEVFNKLGAAVDETLKVLEAINKVIEAYETHKGSLEALIALADSESPSYIGAKLKEFFLAQIAYSAEPDSSSKRKARDAARDAVFVDVPAALRSAEKGVGAILEAAEGLVATGLVKALHELDEAIGDLSEKVEAKDGGSKPAGEKKSLDADAKHGADEDLKGARKLLADIREAIKDSPLGSSKLMEQATKNLKTFKKNATEALSEIEFSDIRGDLIELIDTLAETVKEDGATDPVEIALEVEVTARKIFFDEISPRLTKPFAKFFSKTVTQAAEAFVGSQMDSLNKKLRKAIKKGVKDATDESWKKSKKQAKAAFKGLMAEVGAAAENYAKLIEAVALQRANGLGDSDPMWTDRPSQSSGTLQNDDLNAQLEELKNGEGMDEDAMSDSADGIFGTVLSLLGGLSDALAEVRDGIFFAEYVTGMFTYSTIDNRGVTEAASQEQLCSVISTCGDKKGDGGKGDKKGDGGKGDGGSEGPSTDPGKRMSGADYGGCWVRACAAESEYVLTGVNGPGAVYAMVAAIRLAVNMVVSFRDPIVTAIRTMVSLIPFVSVLAALVPVIAATLQMFDDMARLRGGELVEFLPKILPIFDPQKAAAKALKKLDGFDDAHNKAKKASPPDRAKGVEFGLGYIHYLKIFMIFGWVGDKDGMVRRATDIVQLTMGYEGEKDFRAARAHTAFTVSATYDVEPFFSGMYSLGGDDFSLFKGSKGRHRLTTVGGF